MHKHIPLACIGKGERGEMLYATLTRPKPNQEKGRLKAPELNYSHPAIGELRRGITRFKSRLRRSGDVNIGYSLSHHTELHTRQLPRQADPPEPLRIFSLFSRTPLPPDPQQQNKKPTGYHVPRKLPNNSIVSCTSETTLVIFVVSVIELVRRRHAHPQLPLPLLSLQRQSIHSVAQSFLLLPQLFHLKLLRQCQSISC